MSIEIRRITWDPSHTSYDAALYRVARAWTFGPIMRYIPQSLLGLPDEHDSKALHYLAVERGAPGAETPVGAARLILEELPTLHHIRKLGRTLPNPLNDSTERERAEPSRTGTTKAYHGSLTGGKAFLAIVGQIIADSHERGILYWLFTGRYELIKALYGWFPFHFDLGGPFELPFEQGGPLEPEPLFAAWVFVPDILAAASPTVRRLMFPDGPPGGDWPEATSSIELKELARSNRAFIEECMQKLKEGALQLPVVGD